VVSGLIGLLLLWALCVQGLKLLERILSRRSSARALRRGLTALDASEEAQVKELKRLFELSAHNAKVTAGPVPNHPGYPDNLPPPPPRIELPATTRPNPATDSRF
jgi:hypothetical protein